MHFLTGKSGAGKTSLLSMLYLAQRPTAGTLKVFGNNVALTGRDTLAFLRRRIGVVFQDFRLLEHLSVFDNVALPLRIRGMREKEIRQRVIELLAWVELSHNMYVKSSEISGGEKQRVAIARAVINRPELLLADEPTGNVDSDIAAKLMKLFCGTEPAGNYGGDCDTLERTDGAFIIIRGCSWQTEICFMPKMRRWETGWKGCDG